MRTSLLAAGAAIVLATVAAYHGSLGAPFVLDDAWNIAANPSLRGFGHLGSALSPPPGIGVSGRPVYNLSLALNRAWGGEDVRGYHAVNLAIHVLAALLLFGVVRRTLAGRQAAAVAFCAALLWAIHPLLTGAVTYVSERSEVLMGLFYLGTLYGFARGVGEGRRPSFAEAPAGEKAVGGFDSGGGEGRGGGWFFASWVCCLFGMATKEVMVTAPAMVLLYDRTFVGGTFREAWRRRRAYYLGLASTWLLLAFLMSGTVHAGLGFGQGVSGWTYALTECRVILRYLALAAWPHPLVFDYGLAVVRPAADNLACLAAVAALAGGAAWLCAARKPAGFALAGFFILLAPTSSVVPIAVQPMAESRMYLPLAALAAAAAGLAHAAIRPKSARAFVVVAMILAAGLGVLTVRRNATYRSALALWTDTVTKCPGNPRAQANLGAALLRLGRREEAVARYREALRIDPGFADARAALARLGAD